MECAASSHTPPSDLFLTVGFSGSRPISQPLHFFFFFLSRPRVPKKNKKLLTVILPRCFHRSKTTVSVMTVILWKSAITVLVFAELVMFCIFYVQCFFSGSACVIVFRENRPICLKILQLFRTPHALLTNIQYAHHNSSNMNP